MEQNRRYVRGGAAGSSWLAANFVELRKSRPNEAADDAVELRGLRAFAAHAWLAPINTSNAPSTASALTPLGIHRAQLGLEDLAVIVLRQRIDEHIVLRTLEAGDRVEAEAIELARGGVAHDIGHDDLAPFAVGSSDDGDLAHPRVPEQHLLDLARIDVGAAGDDDVLGAVLERQIAVGVEGAEVAGVQPAIAQGVGGSRRILPIAGHHHVAATENFAALAPGRARSSAPATITSTQA